MASTLQILNLVTRANCLGVRGHRRGVWDLEVSQGSLLRLLHQLPYNIQNIRVNLVREKAFNNVNSVKQCKTFFIECHNLCKCVYMCGQ